MGYGEANMRENRNLPRLGKLGILSPDVSCKPEIALEAVRLTYWYDRENKDLCAVAGNYDHVYSYRLSLLFN